jgi:hypothetical protein
MAPKNLAELGRILSRDSLYNRKFALMNAFEDGDDFDSALAHALRYRKDVDPKVVEELKKSWDRWERLRNRKRRRDA